MAGKKLGQQLSTDKNNVRVTEAQCVHLDGCGTNQGQGQGAKPVNGLESIPVDEVLIDSRTGSSARSDP